MLFGVNVLGKRQNSQTYKMATILFGGRKSTEIINKLHEFFIFLNYSP